MRFSPNVSFILDVLAHNLVSVSSDSRAAHMNGVAGLVLARQFEIGHRVILVVPLSIQLVIFASLLQTLN